MPDIADAYGLAFTQGRVVEQEQQKSRFSVVEAGNVLLPSGYIVACDPLALDPCLPFVQSVIPGRYAVDLALLRSPTAERVAMARIRFTARRPSVWVAALRPGESLETRRDGEPLGYQAESGTGAFMDARAVSRADFAHLEDIDTLLLDLTENYRPHRYWLDLQLDRRLNVVMFSAGNGEGLYASYFGIDDAGDICTLVTDFNLLL